MIKVGGTKNLRDREEVQRRLTANADPADTILYVGIDASERQRTPAIEKGWAPWTVRFPMCDPPQMSKEHMLDWARAEGLRPPRLYEQGFKHNNFYRTTPEARQQHVLVIVILVVKVVRRQARHRPTRSAEA